MRQFIHRDLWGITLANSQNQFGTALVAVFVPLFLIGLGLSVRQVALFYLVYAAVKLIINLPVVQIINRSGSRIGLIYARVANCLFLLGLALAVHQSLRWVIWTLPVWLAFTNAFQFSAQHLHMSRATRTERLGTDLARISTISLIATAIAPAIGATVIAVIGKAGLLVLAFGIVLSSVMWLRSVDKLAGGHQTVQRVHYSLRDAPWRDVAANFAFNFHTVAGAMVWPVYLAVVLHSTAKIGAVTAIGTLVAAVVLLIAGKRTDSRGTKLVLREGSIGSAIVHAGRTLSTSLGYLTGIGIAWSTVLAYQGNAWTSTYYAHTKTKGIHYIMSMEIACDLAYVTLWGFVYAALSFWSEQQAFTTIFVVSAVVALGCMLITSPAKKAADATLSARS